MPIRLSPSVSWYWQYGFISISTLPSGYVYEEESMVLFAPYNFIHLSVGLLSVTRAIIVLLMISLSCFNLGCRSALQAGLRLTSRRCSFWLASTRKSKPKSQKHPSWYLIWLLLRMESVMMKLACWLYRSLRQSGEGERAKRSSTMRVEGVLLSYTVLKMEQLVRCTCGWSLLREQGSCEKRQYAVWYLQMMGRDLQLVTSTHCLMSNLRLASYVGCESRQGLGIYFCIILFQYFFLFLNSFHIFYGFTQYSFPDFTIDIPAPRELAIGFTIHRAVQALQKGSFSVKSWWQWRMRMRTRQSMRLKSILRYYSLLPSRQGNDAWMSASQKCYLVAREKCLQVANCQKQEYLSVRRIYQRYMHNRTRMAVSSPPSLRMEDQRIYQRVTCISSWELSGLMKDFISWASALSILLTAMLLFAVANWSYSLGMRKEVGQQLFPLRFSCNLSLLVRWKLPWRWLQNCPSLSY